MTKTIINYSLLFIILVILQAVIFNNICIFNVATPFVFIYFICRVPMSLPSNWLLTLSFLLGLSVDVFCDTQGMNALACTILGALRNPIFKLYVPREEDYAATTPSIKTLGTGTYIKYIFTLTLIFCILISLIQSLTFLNIPLMLMRIMASNILTFVLLFAIDSITDRKA